MFDIPRPDRVIAVDWSARSKPSPAKPTADAIFICDGSSATGNRTTYHRTRCAAFDAICEKLDQALTTQQTVLLGFDFAFGYPAGFAKHLTGQPDAKAIWAWMAEHVDDGPDNANNRFVVANHINQMSPGVGPFWGCPATLSLPHLPHKGTARTGHGLADRRLVETVVPSAHSVWKLFTTGSVGSQVLMGLPYLHRLRQRFGDQIAFWPFDDAAAPIVCVEIYPSLHKVHYLIPPHTRDPIYHIKDAVQVLMVCDTFRSAPLAAGVWSKLCRPEPPFDPKIAAEEGWIFGAHDPNRAL